MSDSTLPVVNKSEAGMYLLLVGVVSYLAWGTMAYPLKLFTHLNTFELNNYYDFDIKRNLGQSFLWESNFGSILCIFKDLHSICYYSSHTIGWRCSMYLIGTGGDHAGTSNGCRAKHLSLRST